MSWVSRQERSAECMGQSAWRRGQRVKGKGSSQLIAHRRRSVPPEQDLRIIPLYEKVNNVKACAVSTLFLLLMLFLKGVNNPVYKFLPIFR